MKLEVLVPPSPARVLTGPTLHIVEPISFWGGVSATDGTLIGLQGGRSGQSVSGKVLLIRELRGSSSGSSVLLELIHRGIAPTAIILPDADAILALGALVGREMQWMTPAIFRLPTVRQATLPEGVVVSIESEGQVLDFGEAVR